MRHEIVMPKVGLDMEEGTIVEWFKSVGDEVNVGDELISIETDKAVTEIEATVSGKLVEVLVEEDVEVPIGTVIAIVEGEE